MVMSEEYIESHFNDIKAYASIIEDRVDDEYCTIDTVLWDNAGMLAQCQAQGKDYIVLKRSGVYGIMDGTSADCRFITK